MKSRPSRFVAFILFVVSAAIAPLASAQAPLEPAQLPSRTLFYLIWRGAPAADVRKSNSLLALWDDPDFAAARASFASNVLAPSNTTSTTSKSLTPAQLQDFSSLLENSFTLGLLPDPQKTSAAKVALATPPAFHGFFFVYNRTGKEALLTAAVTRMRSEGKDIPKLSQITVAGIPTLKIETTTGVNYWAEFGKYAVAASDTGVLAEIISRLNASSAPSDSLAQTPAYQEAHSLVGSGVLEFFLPIPNLKNAAANSNSAPFKLGPLLDAAKLDAMHSFAGHVTLEGAKTRFQAAFLGDTAPGSIFDIWPDGQSLPAMLAFAPGDSISFSSAQISLPGLYALMKRIAHAVMPPNQQGGPDLLDSLAQARLGMPLSEVTTLFSGEVGSMQNSPSMDPGKQIYFIGITRPADALKLTRTVFSDRITAEKVEGPVTYLKISASAKTGAAGIAQWDFYHAAFTADTILVASRLESVKETIAARNQNATLGLASVPQFQKARKQFPETLTSLSYVDFQKIDWPALKERWISEVRKAAKAKSANPNDAVATDKIADWLGHADPAVFPRHLHVSSSASWKDATGVHVDQWIE